MGPNNCWKLLLFVEGRSEEDRKACQFHNISIAFTGDVNICCFIPDLKLIHVCKMCHKRLSH